MNNSFLSISISLSLSAAAILLSGCGDTHADTGDVAPEAAATYKEGHGLRLNPAALAFAGIEAQEVSVRALGDGREVTSVPKESVLQTVRGDFVYVDNGGWYLLTPVTIGVEDAGNIEVKDGLYEGDLVVTRGVRQLALAQIQALNGGVGCADGH